MWKLWEDTINSPLDTLYSGFLWGIWVVFQERVGFMSVGSEETSRLMESQAHHYRDN